MLPLAEIASHSVAVVVTATLDPQERDLVAQVQVPRSMQDHYHAMTLGLTLDLPHCLRVTYPI
jgi:hypothetical protein